MRTLLRSLLVCVLATAAVALSQETPKAAVPAAPDNPLSSYNKRAFGQFKTFLLRSAEKMPEENYNFKPTESVRSFGQILGHVAEDQYVFCSSVIGEKNPDVKVEKTKTSKADLTAALKDAFGYCDKAYDGLTDATAPQMVKFFGRDMAKLSVLSFNNIHNAEHYGNIITYLRMKNIVPPSSEPPPQPPPKK
jgi:uncharacterized damage-inducible protein DinB